MTYPLSTKEKVAVGALAVTAVAGLSYFSAHFDQDLFACGLLGPPTTPEGKQACADATARKPIMDAALVGGVVSALAVPGVIVGQRYYKRPVTGAVVSIIGLGALAAGISAIRKANKPPPQTTGGP